MLILTPSLGPSILVQRSRFEQFRLSQDDKIISQIVDLVKKIFEHFPLYNYKLKFEPNPLWAQILVSGYGLNNLEFTLSVYACIEILQIVAL